MKNFTQLSILVLLTVGSAGTSFAQSAAIGSTKNYDGAGLTYAYSNVRNITVTNANTESSATVSDLANEKTAAFLKYVRSEQFVFDNLSSLKKSYSVPDIYYDLDKATIRTDAEEVLDNLVNLMVEQPQLSVAVTAHCDSRVSGYNQTLAVKRAQAAVDYLALKGIAKDRIVLEQHGRTEVKNPCDTNPGCSIAEQQLNRKTEFNVIVNGKNLAHVKAYGE